MKETLINDHVFAEEVLEYILAKNEKINDLYYEIIEHNKGNAVKVYTIELINHLLTEIIYDLDDMEDIDTGR